jgi:hypothetical protein
MIDNYLSSIKGLVGVEVKDQDFLEFLEFK